MYILNSKNKYKDSKMLIPITKLIVKDITVLVSNNIEWQYKNLFLIFCIVSPTINREKNSVFFLVKN